jgi:general stress protein YciG
MSESRGLIGVDIKLPREEGNVSNQITPELREYMRQIGRKGGQARSERKTEANREKCAKRLGRPYVPPVR